MVDSKRVYNQTQLRNLKRASIKYKQEQLKLAFKKGESEETISGLTQEINNLKQELKKLS